MAVWYGQVCVQSHITLSYFYGGGVQTYSETNRNSLTQTHTTHTHKRTHTTHTHIRTHTHAHYTHTQTSALKYTLHYEFELGLCQSVAVSLMHTHSHSSGRTNCFHSSAEMTIDFLWAICLPLAFCWLWTCSKRRLSHAGGAALDMVCVCVWLFKADVWLHEHSNHTLLYFRDVWHVPHQWPLDKVTPHSVGTH